MKWDVKIAVYLVLAYIAYGVSYLITDGDFVVPYPVLLYALPALSLYYVFSAGLNKYSLFILFFPLVPLNQWIYLAFPQWGDIVSIVSVVSYVILGGVFLLDKKLRDLYKRSKVLLVFIGLITSGWILLLANSWVTIIYFSVLAITGSLVIREIENNSYLDSGGVRKVFIFITLNAWLYCITWLSFFQNSLSL